MICEYCGKEFEGKRSTAKYCSDKCRKLAFQKLAFQELPVDAKIAVSVPTELSVPVSVPGRDDIYSDNYDTSEAGFKRRNKAWDSLGQSFKTNLMARCIRINADHVRDRMECIAMREKIATACR